VLGSASSSGGICSRHVLLLVTPFLFLFLRTQRIIGCQGIDLVVNV